MNNLSTEISKLQVGKLLSCVKCTAGYSVHPLAYENNNFSEIQIKIIGNQ